MPRRHYAQARCIRERDPARIAMRRWSVSRHSLGLTLEPAAHKESIRPRREDRPRRARVYNVSKKQAEPGGCMTSSVSRRLILVCAILTILAIPVVGYAQEATVSGTVTDSTAAVLPGVTIKAVNEASGNSFEAVTDARGAYRIALRIGVYNIK